MTGVPTMADLVDVEVVPDSNPTPTPAAPAPAAEEVEAAELAALQQTVEFCGRRFPIRPQGVSLLALMKFAAAAKRQQQRRDAGAPGAANEMDGLDALYALIRSCIDEGAWEAFEEYGIEQGAGADELMAVVRDAVQAAAERPTRPRSGSPAGLSTTGPSSAGGSSSLDMSSEAVQARLEAQGRPDVARVVQIAREHGAGSIRR